MRDFSWFSYKFMHISLLAAVATISAGNDEFLGNLIADAIDRIGPDGFISVENSQTSETSVIVEEGMKVIHASAIDSFRKRIFH